MSERRCRRNETWGGGGGSEKPGDPLGDQGGRGPGEREGLEATGPGGRSLTGGCVGKGRSLEAEKGAKRAEGPSGQIHSRLRGRNVHGSSQL